MTLFKASNIFRSSQAGTLQFKRYQNLVALDDLPFVRASGQDRVIDSATNWTAGKRGYIWPCLELNMFLSGFALASNGVYEPKLSLTIPESKTVESQWNFAHVNTQPIS